VFCVLFAILATEKSGMPNAQIAKRRIQEAKRKKSEEVEV
jgi:hypothetical protein